MIPERTLRLLGTRRIVISGGEPTLHPRLAEIISHYAALVDEVVVITNGYTLSRRGEEGVERLARAGATGVTFSVDSADPRESLLVRGTPPAVHAAVLAEIRRAAAGAGIEIGVNATVTSATAGWAAAGGLLGFGLGIGVDFVKFQPVFDDGYASARAPWLLLSGADAPGLLDVARRLRSRAASRRQTRRGSGGTWPPWRRAGASLRPGAPSARPTRSPRAGRCRCARGWAARGTAGRRRRSIRARPGPSRPGSPAKRRAARSAPTAFATREWATCGRGSGACGGLGAGRAPCGRTAAGGPRGTSPARGPRLRPPALIGLGPPARAMPKFHPGGPARTTQTPRTALAAEGCPAAGREGRPGSGFFARRRPTARHPAGAQSGGAGGRAAGAPRDNLC